jgi:hypothetical protein
LADIRDVLEHRFAAKQHLVNSIQGMHKGDRERGMLNPTPTVHSTCSNWYQVPAQVDKVRFHLIESARDNIEKHYDLHSFQSAAEHLECIEYLLADYKNHFPIAEGVEGCVRNPKSKSERVQS